MRLPELTSDLFDYLVAFRQKAEAGVAAPLDQVRKELWSTFANMEEQVRRNPGLSGFYQQIRYPLVVLADEVLISSAWKHAREWESELLEQRYFGTNVAGDRFFENLERAEELPSDVAGVYYRALLLGFRNHFTPGDPKLQELQHRLLARVDPDDETAEELVSPSAYEVGLEGSRRLPRLWRWRYTVLIAVGLIVVFVLVERFVVWPLLIAPISQTADRAQAVMNEQAQATLFGGPLAVDSGVVPDESPTDSPPDPAPEPAVEAEEPASLPEAEPTRFVLEVGQYQRKATANKRFRKLRKKGLQPAVHELSSDEGLSYLVLLAIAENKDDAEARRAEILETHQLSVAVRAMPTGTLQCLKGCD